MFLKEFVMNVWLDRIEVIIKVKLLLEIELDLFLEVFDRYKFLSKFVLLKFLLIFWGIFVFGYFCFGLG